MLNLKKLIKDIGILLLHLFILILILCLFRYLATTIPCLNSLSGFIAKYSKKDRYWFLFGGCFVLAYILFYVLQKCELDGPKAGKKRSVIISTTLLITILSNLLISVVSNIATNQLVNIFNLQSDNAAGQTDGDSPYTPKETIPDSDGPNYPSVNDFTVGWYDNSGRENGRQFYTINDINSGALGDTIVFNSISNSVIGHEANFVGARENTGINLGKENVWNGNSIKAEEGKTYLIRLFAHNNSPNGYESIAHDVRLRFEISDTVFVTKPKESENAYQAAIHGYITCSNANPTWYMDGVKFTSDRPFHLQYVFGSAYFTNNAFGPTSGYNLSDDIMNQGVLIGYDELNGDIPGCYEYASYTLITVMPVFD